MGHYTGRYQPYQPDPIPVVEETSITFTEPTTYATFSEVAIIDTGADVSNIPSRLVTKHHLPAHDEEEITDPNGNKTLCDVYYLRVHITGLSSVIERFVEYGFNELILGRNLLNRWRIILDPSRKRPPVSEEIRIED